LEWKGKISKGRNNPWNNLGETKIPLMELETLERKVLESCLVNLFGKFN